MLIQITHKMSSKVLFSLDAEPNSLCRTLEAGARANATLDYAHLYGADLRGADLYGADLHGADLRGADLRLAKNSELAQARCSIVPESGNFDGWKLCRNNVLVHVRIPAEARRSNATGRKCRAEFMDVLEIIGAEEGISLYDSKTIYRAGERLTCDTWDENRWQECSGGLHLYLTRIEAENNT